MTTDSGNSKGTAAPIPESASAAYHEAGHAVANLRLRFDSHGARHTGQTAAPRHPGNAAHHNRLHTETLKGCHKVAPGCATLSALSGIIAP
jgi:hypothetical protein